MGSDPTFRVTAYPRWWRLVAAVAFVASRTSLPMLVFAVLGSRFAVEAVTVVRWFVTFVALPALLAAAIARALEATLRIGEKDLTIVRAGLQVDVPLASIDRVSVWRLPFPSAGLTVRLASGRSLPQTIGATDPMPVLETLSRYGAAYSRLDASAARAVWPSVDVRALGRAFSELRSQRVTLADCDIAVDGARAKAACRGAATYVPRAGDQNPRTEARDWRFELEKGRDANWRIASATISVPRESTRGR